jgi:hypothetical protein
VSYKVETYWNNNWIKIIEGSKQFCEGYILAKQDYSPRVAYRLIKEGKMLREWPAREDVKIGQIAGWPTAEQYEKAAQKALDMAKLIREKS